MIRRREFFGLAAAVPAAAASINIAGIKSRGTKKVEIVYKSPHTKPNGLQATREGLWILDQGNTNFVSLVNFADGKVIREFQPDINGASGVTVHWFDDVLLHPPQAPNAKSCMTSGVAVKTCASP